MAAKRHDRTQARRSALQVLYAGEINEASPSQMVDEGLVLEDETKLSNYAKGLVYGVDAHRMSIDRCLGAVSENWDLDRMSVVDRSILRLAVYEILFVDAVPASVCINEAVELAKEFGGEDESSRFVNGVLGRIARLLESGRMNPDGTIVPDESEPDGEGAEAEESTDAEVDVTVEAEASEEADVAAEASAPAEAEAFAEAEASEEAVEAEPLESPADDEPAPADVVETE